MIVTNFFQTEDKVNLRKKEILWKGVKFYIIAQSIVFAVLFFLFILLKIMGIDPNIFKEVKGDDGFYNSSLSIALLAPFLEEIAFRLGLSFKKTHAIISFPLLALFVLRLFFKSDYMLITHCIVPLIVFILIWFSKKSFWINYKHKWGKQTIFCITLLFAFGHIGNFSIQMNYLPIYFLFCSPQIIMGITFTYLRLNLNFTAAVLMHIAVNSFSILV